MWPLHYYLLLSCSCTLCICVIVCLMCPTHGRTLRAYEDVRPLPPAHTLQSFVINALPTRRIFIHFFFCVVTFSSVQWPNDIPKNCTLLIIRTVSQKYKRSTYMNMSHWLTPLAPIHVIIVTENQKKKTAFVMRLIKE